MSLPVLEQTAAVGLVGLAIVQSMAMYRDACPKLADIRRAPVGDYAMRQDLLDADIYGSLAVAIIGGTVGVLTRSWLPLFLGSTGLVLLSAFHRAVLNSPSPDRPD